MTGHHPLHVGRTPCAGLVPACRELHGVPEAAGAPSAEGLLLYHRLAAKHGRMHAAPPPGFPEPARLEPRPHPQTRSGGNRR